MFKEWMSHEGHWTTAVRGASLVIRIDEAAQETLKYLHGVGVIPEMASLFMRVKRVRFGLFSGDPSYRASANDNDPLGTVPEV